MRLLLPAIEIAAVEYKSRPCVPVPVMTLLAMIVELICKVPELVRTKPAPDAAVEAPVAVLPKIVLLLTVTLPEVIWMPPPPEVPAAVLPATVIWLNVAAPES